MKLNRSEIKKFMDEELKKSNYYSKTNELKDEFNIMNSMSLKDLDYLDILKVLLKEIKNNYDNLIEGSWVASKRQEFLINNLNRTLNEIESDNCDMQGYRDFYFNVWDYFDDYGNKNEDIAKEEMDPLILILDRFFNII